MQSFTLPLVSARHLERALSSVTQDDDRTNYHTAGRCEVCGHILGSTRILGYDGYEDVLTCTNQSCDAHNEPVYFAN